jgi:hypothetical protein
MVGCIWQAGWVRGKKLQVDMQGKAGPPGAIAIY